MYRASLTRSLAAIFVALSLLGLGFVPMFAKAGKQANAMCTPVYISCSCGMKPSKTGCITGENWHDCPAHCVDVEPGGTVWGHCTEPNKCNGDFALDSQNNVVPIDKIAGDSGGLLGDIGKFIKDNPLITGLGMGLLQSLMSGSGSGSGNNNNETKQTTSVCTTQYYYTSNTGALTDPCAIYSANAAGTTGTGGTTDNGVSGLLNNLGSNSPGISLPSSTAGSISPYSPITAIDTSGSSSVSQPFITVPNPVSGMNDTGTQTPVPVSDVLNNGQYYTNATSTSTPSAAQTPLNQNPVPVPTNGLHGDILSFGGGATIYASSRSGNTEISGFYGSKAGGTSQSAAGRMCQSRPWTNNFLSYIIPPTFFDNLCSWGGYQVGAVQTASYSGGGGSGSGGGTSRNVSVQPPKSNTVYGNPVQAQVKIWARPASVSLGGRTTIFWTSQNVTSCSESSSDGNFSGQSTSGGASTVALSGATKFSIQCNTVDGKTVSDSTTVGIGI